MITAVFDQRRDPVTGTRLALVTGLLALLLLSLCLIAISTGTVALPVTRVLGILTGAGESTEAERLIILSVRLPRLLLALCVGAGLSVAGLVFQALLRNPLAEPYILGISSGGTVGTLLALALALARGRALRPEATQTP